jgi:hypothetical protein
MPQNDAGPPSESNRYRKLASDLRAIVPTFKDPEVIADLRALAACYESLALRHEGMAESALEPDRPDEVPQ